MLVVEDIDGDDSFHSFLSDAAAKE